MEEKVRVRTAYYHKLIAENAGYLPIQNANLAVLGAEDMLGYALRVRNGERIDLRDDEIPAEISVFRIGNHLIAGYPGEVFVEYGLKLKEMALAGTTFVFELSNGCLPGYCISDDAYEEDGYEAGNCMLKPGYGDKIVAEAAALARRVMAQ